MFNVRRLILAHFSVAFAVLAVGLILGEWQMIVRSPLHAWVQNPEHYYRSVTAHGSSLAYVFPTLVAMGFGYAISVTALRQPLAGLRLAWIAFYLLVLGALVSMVPVALGRASVLYTFYPPLIANAFYYIGIVLVVVGSWIWVGILHVNYRVWKARNANAPLPLPMFANLAGAISGHGRRSARHSKSYCKFCPWRCDGEAPSMRDSRECFSPGRCTPSSTSG